MPEWMQYMAALLGGGFLGGLAQFVRTRGQNRVDDRSQLSAEQLALRQRVDAELARLDQRILGLENENKELRKTNLDQYKQVASLETSQAVLQEDNKDLSALVEQLRTTSISQGEQLIALADEKAQLTQRVQVAEHKYQFIERENNTLRTENARLRAMLPNRVELPVEVPNA